jgi:hypothetical protein
MRRRRCRSNRLAGNLTAASWPDVYHLLLGADAHKADKVFLRKLSEQLTNRTERKLAKTSRLIVWKRITSGDIQFEGKGLQVDDDLFTVAGRANWILRTLTKKKFGYVLPEADETSLKSLQSRWRSWLDGESVAEVADPYPTAVKGLEEIRSLAALEALIVSLQPGEAKERVTKKCLSLVYHLDELPADPTSQARYCSPDTYTAGYLPELTEEKESHDAAWWGKWWAAHGKHLRWNPETGKFAVNEERTKR